ncbi:hypothetical protein Zmor_021456 [Zophobas morio]|uniref:FXNA-like protease n=1 Tax=Zophobas morio TaxID=2755281 RepID=A0AA38MBH7_9CUCU|nr:hypothetical protein Zmor_021456 [Zophobas morio]
MKNSEECVPCVPLNGCKQTTRKMIFESVSVFTSFGVIITLLSLYGIVYVVDNTLPTPLKLTDEETYPDSFIAERAQNDLKALTGIGSRVVGGYKNENLTVDFLQNEINSIIHEAHTNHKIEIDTQVVTGAHYLDYKPNGKIVPYSNLQNIVVKLYAANDTSDSVLINAHFDSVPTSPGGSDDGINVVVMLEILRKLSKEPQRPLNNVVFLFNGAEETCLQASHGFITQHKWAQDCKVVLNLEAAGAGGKIILFQSGPKTPWLMKYYAHVPHPYGQAAGEEIFQTNLLPSDTDFRIFRDYGGLVGFDMAFFKNGYRYHTQYDDFEHIPLGSFQHVGDNVLSLVRSLANAPEVASPKSDPGKVVFFDFLGLFMVSYTQTVASVINLCVVVFSFVIFVLSIHRFKLGYTTTTLKYLVLTFGTIIGGWILAGVFVILLALLIDKIGYSMSWFTNTWLIFGLYVIPTVGLSTFPLSIKFRMLNPNVRTHMQANCMRMIWTVILFFGTVLGIRAVYALMIPVLFSSVGFVFVYVLKLQHSIRKWLIPYLASLIIPTIFLMYGTLTIFSLFIPMTGRIGPNKNVEVMIGILSLFLTIAITSPLVALATMVRKFKYLLYFFTAVFALTFIIIFTPLGFPYSDHNNSPTPERYWIIHTQRLFHNQQGVIAQQDSGYFLLNLDRHSPSMVKNMVKEIGTIQSIDQDCENYLFCGLPLVHSRMVQVVKYSSWIPAKQPVLPEQPVLKVLSKSQVNQHVIRYNVTVSGPDRLAVYLSPKTNTKIVNISLIERLPSERTVWNDRDIFFILHVYGKERAALKFTFDVEVSTNATNLTTEVAVAGIFVHDEQNNKTEEYSEFLNEFPSWADVTAWIGSYESFWI